LIYVFALRDAGWFRTVFQVDRQELELGVIVKRKKPGIMTFACNVENYPETLDFLIGKVAAQAVP
jgi:hypothetical protein